MMRKNQKQDNVILLSLIFVIEYDNKIWISEEKKS